MPAIPDLIRALTRVAGGWVSRAWAWRIDLIGKNEIHYNYTAKCEAAQRKF
jgi:hypothetical protein